MTYLKKAIKLLGENDMDEITARTIKDAYEYFEGYGIDFTQYGDPILDFPDDYGPGEITWVHKTSGNEMLLTDVWIKRETGEILQAGSSDFGL